MDDSAHGGAQFADNEEGLTTKGEWGWGGPAAGPQGSAHLRWVRALRRTHPPGPPALNQRRQPHIWLLLGSSLAQ